jgi:ACR3 family arsenite transporter
MSNADALQDRAQGERDIHPVKDDSPSEQDIEKQPCEAEPEKELSSAFKALGWLDRLLALWILLAMIIGILLGNFVPSTGPALQKGKFVGVSIPIGMQHASHTHLDNACFDH